MRLDDVDVHLLALAERHALLLDLGPRALLDDREVVERQPLGAGEVEERPVSSSSACSIRAPSPMKYAVTFGFIRTR